MEARGYISTQNMSMEESSSSGDGSQITPRGKRLGFLRRNKLVSYSTTLLNQAAAPIVSSKMLQPKKPLGRTTILFLFKMASLEFVRQVSMARCPQLWWGLHVVPLVNVLGFHWLPKSPPFKFLLTGIQALSKPIICLSLASNLYHVLGHKRATKHVECSTNMPMASEQSSLERCSPEQEETAIQGMSNHPLREVILKDGATLTARISDEELDMFLLAAHANVKRAVTSVKKSLKWREKFHFLTSSELEVWSHLIFWHGRDAKLRPTLVIRLGVAYSKLSSQLHWQFAQAVISQVEYGVLNLVHKEDPRVIVVMDCRGTSVLGFPVQMMKSCCICLQKNYPTRLACLVAVNVPPVVRVIAAALIQVLTPATRQKIHVEGEAYARLLAHLEGFEHIVLCLAGTCKCLACEKAHLAHNLENHLATSTPSLSNLDHLALEPFVHDAGHCVSSQTLKGFVRKFIMGILFLLILMIIRVSISSYPSEAE